MRSHHPSWLQSIWHRLRPPPPDFIVPQQFNRNSQKVSSLMPPQDSGAWLLERMRQRIGLKTLAASRLLDFGCGVRFTQAILNHRIPIRSYTGIDCFAEMIDFLRSTVRDPRFSYVLLDAHHPLYNPKGRPLSNETELPLPLHAFDVISLFSVITHQNPDDAAFIFSLLRRHTATQGASFSLASWIPGSPSSKTGARTRTAACASTTPISLPVWWKAAAGESSKEHQAKDP